MIHGAFGLAGIVGATGEAHPLAARALQDACVA